MQGASERVRVRWLIFGLAGLVVMALGGLFLLREGLIKRIQEERAERLYAEAQAAYAAEQWEEASRKGNAAHYLTPDRGDIILLVARSLWKQRLQTAILWWEKLLEEPELPVDELREVTEVVLRGGGQLELGLRFLNRLVELDGRSGETQRLWLRAMEQQRRVAGIYQLAGLFAQEGSEPWEVHARYINLEQRVADGGQRRAVEHLLGLLRADGAMAPMAARELMRMAGLSDAERVEAGKFLLRDSEQRLDKLMGLAVLVRAGQAEREAMLAHVEAMLVAPRPGEVEELVAWARWAEEEAWLLEALDWNRYRAADGSISVYLNWLLSLGREQEVLRLVEQSFVAGAADAPLYLFFRGQAQARAGLAEEAERSLLLAVQTSAAANSGPLERELFRLRRYDLLAELYRSLQADQGTNPVFRQKLLGSLYYTGQDRGLREELQMVDLRTPQDSTGTDSFLLYLRLATLNDAEAVHRDLEERLVLYPEVWDYRLVLALSFKLQGLPDVARQMVAAMPTLEVNAPRYMRVCAIALGLVPADRLLLPDEWDTLLPRELLWLSQATN